MESKVFSAVEFVSNAVASIRRDGWRKGGVTARAAANAEVEATEEDVAEARSAIAWATGLEPRSEFEEKMKRAVEGHFVLPEERAVAAYLPVAFAKEKEKAVAKMKAAEEAAYAKGRRGIKVTRVAYRSLGESAFGPRCAITFEDSEGHSYEWRTDDKGPDFRAHWAAVCGNHIPIRESRVTDSNDWRADKVYQEFDFRDDRTWGADFSGPCALTIRATIGDIVVGKEGRTSAKVTRVVIEDGDVTDFPRPRGTKWIWPGTKAWEECETPHDGSRIVG